jgi:hypothetical protein
MFHDQQSPDLISSQRIDPLHFGKTSGLLAVTPAAPAAKAPLRSGREPYRERLDPAQEVRIGIDRLAEHLDLQVTPEDFLPEDF